MKESNASNTFSHKTVVSAKRTPTAQRPRLTRHGPLSVGDYNIRRNVPVESISYASDNTAAVNGALSYFRDVSVKLRRRKSRRKTRDKKRLFTRIWRRPCVCIIGRKKHSSSRARRLVSRLYRLFAIFCGNNCEKLTLFAKCQRH